MEANLRMQSNGYLKTGIAIFEDNEVFSNEEIFQLTKLCKTLPEEHIIVGDAGEKNDVYVGRIIIDLGGELPKVVNAPISTEILKILKSKQTFFDDLFQEKMVIRRCQVNRLVENSFIGRHLDAASNPSYHVAVVVQLSKSYEGGEFVIYPQDKPDIISKTKFGDVVVTRSDIEHSVSPVKSGERTSLVYFYSKNTKENPRAEKVFSIQTEEEDK